jgi:hypothetical protein
MIVERGWKLNLRLDTATCPRCAKRKDARGEKPAATK